MTRHFVRPLLVGAFFCAVPVWALPQEAPPATTPTKPPTPVQTTPVQKPPVAAPAVHTAIDASDPKAAEKLAVKVTLSDGVRTVVRTREELGFGLTSLSPVVFKVDQTALQAALKRIAPTFAQEAVNARPFVYKGQVSIKPGSDARTLNVPETAALLAKEVEKNAATTKLSVLIIKKPPVLSQERLQGIDGVLGTMTTHTSDNPKRNTNIKVAVEFIDGVLLSPGEKFSLNGIVGERTQARGFRTAPVFVNAELVPGIGGGVSQVTGTMFNAAAKAGLKINEVNPHSRPVAYLPIGTDATVAWGDKDLKFTNDTKYPVFVAMHYHNRVLTATLFGHKTPGRQISLRPSVQELAPGKVNAQMYRVIKENGKIVRKEKLFSHAYRWDPTKKE